VPAGFEYVRVPTKLNINQRLAWIAKQKNVSMVCELHLDSATPQATGSTAFYVGGNNWAMAEARKFSEVYAQHA
jgi:N-acetylmuramoyl-L-alanine amidase